MSRIPIKRTPDARIPRIVIRPASFSYSAADFDSSSGCDLSFELSSDVLSPSPMRRPGQRPAAFSPPYKKVRALRLFDSPLTPKTIMQKCAADTPVPRVRLFSEKPLAVPSAYEEKPMANSNPFKPTGLLITKKRTRSIRSLVGSPQFPPLSLNDSDMSDAEPEQPTKRVALQENNISRYHKEFVEVEIIGSGHFGSVYKCINRLDGCVYAIKKSTKPVAGSISETTALNEVYAHAVLGKHQHVVRYYSAWAEDNHMIIQNEYCNGGSLADRISAGGLNLDELRKLVLHVAEGLRYIHSEGLVHLDIKPGNIFISKEKKLQINYDSADDGFEELDETQPHEEITYKIGDLGHVTSLSKPKVEEGDCRYLSNEVLHEDYAHLTKADVFSLGLTVIEAGGGGPLPKNGDAWHKLREGVLPPKVEAVMGRELAGLVRLMIHPSAMVRPTAMQILHHSALSPIGKKTRSQLHRELNAEKLKNEILAKQLNEAAMCIKSLTPEGKQLNVRLSSRLIGKKVNRSVSTTTF